MDSRPKEVNEEQSINLFFGSLSRSSYVSTHPILSSPASFNQCEASSCVVPPLLSL